jgi:hypothetical protein
MKNGTSDRIALKGSKIATCETQKCFYQYQLLFNMAVLVVHDKVKRNRASFNTDLYLEHSTPIFGLPMISFSI